ncbi:ANTAR domain-containing response regulator [uncultured Arcanobacterium sp.]|uniref:ANTAR domain-containing response regulator n=1 Tax=uncultured Arcanobacterium sp. TaxID=487520 RepID=UPI002630D367|nr:response regulator [uncultured Arcanobacterium sp.]
MSEKNNPTAGKSSPEKPIRALVAEDETLIRLDIVETLQDAGYEIVGAAANGAEAVEMAAELKPELIVMDIKMPVKDGIAAAEEILNTQNCAIVMLTAFSQKDLVEKARDAGAMAYVVKPFTPADLLPAIEIAISRSQEMVALEAEIANMEEKFTSRKIVSRAKGLLQEKMGFTESEAFRWIQKTSMDRRLTMREVAEAVIEQVG